MPGRRKTPNASLIKHGLEQKSLAELDADIAAAEADIFRLAEARMQAMNSPAGYVLGFGMVTAGAVPVRSQVARPSAGIYATWMFADGTTPELNMAVVHFPTGRILALKQAGGEQGHPVGWCTEYNLRGDWRAERLEYPASHLRPATDEEALAGHALASSAPVGAIMPASEVPTDAAPDLWDESEE
jgi:hypothetical protein